MTRPPRRYIAITIALLLLAVWAARIDVPNMTGPIKGDEATYIAMAFSVAEDADLKYKREDYQRFVELYGQGPEGVFLKRSMDLDWTLRAGWPPLSAELVPVPPTAELDYAKPFAFSVVAAPFVRLLGPGGLLLFNGLLLALSLLCAVAFCRARMGPVSGTLLGISFICASVVPVYVVWQTPEVFNFTLVLVAYFLWLYKEVAPPSAPSWIRHPGWDWVAAVLLAAATFSKPPNAPLIAPLVLVAWHRRQLMRGLGLGLVFGLVAGGLFGLNALIAGDWNYQGGDRASFYTRFPFDEQGTVFASGNPMSTNEANDQNILEPGFLFPMLQKNLVYFFVGRDAGLIPYFFPGALILLLWLARIWRSTPWQWATALACGLSVLALLVLAPLSWNGGGGPIGNRYFLSLYPALLFLVPAGTGMLGSVLALGGGALFLSGILLHPVAASQKPWLNPERWPLRELPVEFTLINDLPVFLNQQRGRVLVSEDPEVFLYYMDGNTYFQEAEGFWVAPGTADIVVRTAKPLTGLDLGLRSPIDNEVRISLGESRAPVSLRAGEEQTVRFRPEPGVHANGYQILLRIETSKGFYPKDLDPDATDTRHLGVFVRPTYEAR